MTVALAHIVFVQTAELMSMTEPKLQLFDSTYPTKPDAELRLRQHGEVKPLGAWLDVVGLLFALQGTKQPPGPAG